MSLLCVGYEMSLQGRNRVDKSYAMEIIVYEINKEKTDIVST